MFDEHTRGQPAHLAQWLADCGEGRAAIGGFGDVVEADHREIAGHIQTVQVCAGNDAKGGLIAAREDSGRRMGQCDQPLNAVAA